MKYKAGGTYKTTREVYKAVKRYDRLQFDEFCTDIYTEGYRDGEASVPVISLDEITEKIKTVKGIGIIRRMKINAALTALFREKAMKEEIQHESNHGVAAIRLAYSRGDKGV